MNVRAALRPHKAAPVCSTPAPTPAGAANRGYFLHAKQQRLVEATLAGYVGARPRALKAKDDEEERKAACCTLCSKAGYTTPPFFFSLEAGGEGAHYCWTDGRYVRYGVCIRLMRKTVDAADRFRAPIFLQ